MSKRGRPPIDDSAALEAMADYFVAHPELDPDDPSDVRKVIDAIAKTKPHLIAPTKAERARAN